MAKDPHKMTEAEIEALDRRNNYKLDLILQQQNEMKEIVERSDRALRGSNGDPGLTSHVQTLQANHAICSKAQADMVVLLHGNPRDKTDTGMVGEQTILKRWMEESKETARETKIWMRGLVSSVVVAIAINVIVAWLALKP